MQQLHVSSHILQSIDQIYSNFPTTWKKWEKPAETTPDVLQQIAINNTLKIAE